VDISLSFINFQQGFSVQLILSFIFNSWINSKFSNFRFLRKIFFCCFISDLYQFGNEWRCFMPILEIHINFCSCLDFDL
jgi:hypothetical protein